MLHQITDDMALLTGFLYSEPSEKHDKHGNRIVVLEVAYDKYKRRNEQLRLLVYVADEYTSYARTLKKGDCVMCVGLRPVKYHNFTTMVISRKCYGFIGGTGIARSWVSEAEAYTKNKLARTKKKNKADNEYEDDKFSEIRGDLY